MKIALTLNREAVHLVASCLGDEDTGGGLLYYDGQTWSQLDDVSTTGLFATESELIRMLWAPSQVAEGTAILRYSARGLVGDTRIPGFVDPHDVLWDGQHYVAVSSLHDSIIWLSPTGDIIRRYQPAMGADCWHLNCLTLHEGVLYATAFGRFEEARGWVGHQRVGTGMLFRVDTGEDVISGLCCPHTPRRHDNGWILCTSSTSELREFTARKPLTARRAQLEGWVRGLTFTDHFILVGESVNRQLSSDVGGATVAVLDRETWKVLGRLNLPYREVYDLVLVSATLLDGVKRSPSPRKFTSCPLEIPRNSDRSQR